MSTDPEFFSKKCPPCMGDCKQGRNCPAYGYQAPYAEPDVDFMFWSIVALGMMMLCGFCVWVGTTL